MKEGSVTGGQKRMEAKAGVLFLHPNQFDGLILQYQKISVLTAKTPLTLPINAYHKD